MPSDTPQIMTPDEIDAIRAEVRAVIDAEGIAQTIVAKETGIPYGTFTSWLGGTYAGRNDRLAGEARKWLRERQVKAQTVAMAPEPPRFVATPTAERIMVLLTQAKVLADFVVGVGQPGIGKTTAACQFTRSNTNVFKVVAHPTLSRPRALLQQLARIVNVQASTGKLDLIHAALVSRLRGTNALVIVDEANFLEPEALQQLRSLHDQAEIGVALLGNATIHHNIEGRGRRAEFAQLTSRVGMRIDIRKPDKGDVETLLDAWGVTGDAERRQLRVIAAKPGALRTMTKTLRLAHMLAAAERRRPNTADIADAYAQLGAAPLSPAEAA